MSNLDVWLLIIAVMTLWGMAVIAALIVGADWMLKVDRTTRKRAASDAFGPYCQLHTNQETAKIRAAELATGSEEKQQSALRRILRILMGG